MNWRSSYGKEPGLEEVLLVALTGYGQEEDRRRALAAGFDEHLTKPTRFDTLQRCSQRERGPRRCSAVVAQAQTARSPIWKASVV